MKWFGYLYKVWKREFRLTFTDAGVLLFFLALPTLYPVVYTLIYNPEVVRDIPVAIVDNSRTAASRDLSRKIDATPSAHVIGYASSKSEARTWHAEKRCYAVVEIPADYARKIGRGEQATINLYCDMSLLLRYRALLLDFTNMQMAVDAELRQQTIDRLGDVASSVTGSSRTVGSNPVFIGDTTQGFASFVIPGIMVLILQQSLLLGVTMLAGGAAERRRRNEGIDPEAVHGAPSSAVVLGRMLCHITIYAPLTLYMLHCIPAMFELPDAGHLAQYWLFIMPMMIASSFLGITIGVFVTERESSMLVMVFTSVVFLFLSGLTWPRYAMNGFWTIIGDAIPATWGVEGFIRMLSNGATLRQQSDPYIMLWVLCGIYFITAWLLTAAYRRTAVTQQA